MEHCPLYQKNLKEVEYWFNFFLCNYPSNTCIIYYTIQDFLSMLFIIAKKERQFGKIRFKVTTVDHNCLCHFQRQFCFKPLIDYLGILKEWIKRFKESIPAHDTSKHMPFTQELLFVLFNYFASHGKCCLINFV